MINPIRLWFSGKICHAGGQGEAREGEKETRKKEKWRVFKSGLENAWELGFLSNCMCEILL